MPFGEKEEAKTSFSHDLGLKSNHDFVVSISSSNTPIGQCLEEALLVMKMPNSTKDSKDGRCIEKGIGANVEEIYASEDHLDSDAMQSIRQAFGGSMARQQIRESQNIAIDSLHDNVPYHQRSSPESAPKVLLYGRLDHYNRVGQNWRLVADNVGVTEKRPVSHERAAKRRRHSFWDTNSRCERKRQDEQKKQKKSGGLQFGECHEIQILAYNDF